MASPGDSWLINSVKLPCTVVPLEVILPVPACSFSKSISVSVSFLERFVVLSCCVSGSRLRLTLSLQ